jgi:serine/threonine protein kinase
VRNQIAYTHRAHTLASKLDVVQIKMQHLLKTLLEVAYAIRHLHNMHILHRDLKIQNILLKSSNRDQRGFTVKVSDFGLAKIWDGRVQGSSPTERQKYAGA